MRAQLTSAIVMAMMSVATLGVPSASAAPAGAGAAAKLDPAQAKADKLFAEGQRHYNAGEFQEAIAAFNDAYALVHDPVYLFNVAQAYRKIGDCENASSFYQRYLAEDADASNRAKVEQWLRELQPCVDQRHAEVEAARKQADAHTAVIVTKPVAVVVQHPADVDAHPGRTLRISGIAIGGVGLVALVIGAGYAKHGASLESQIRSDCASAAGCSWDSGVNDEASKDSEGNRANTIATIGLVGGGAAVIVGAALYYFGMHRAAEHVSVAPVEGGAGAAASVGWTF